MLQRNVEPSLPGRRALDVMLVVGQGLVKNAPMARASTEQSDDVHAVNAALLSAVATEQDRNAFARLFAFYAPRIKSYLMKNGAEFQAADDLVQDVMLTVWRKADQFDPKKASVSTWIYTIARNRRIDVLRRERHPEPDPHDPAFVPEAEPQADHVVELDQRKRALHSKVADLPHEQAEPLRMAFFKDMSHSMIAEQLGLPLGTVKARIRLAMGKLRPTLEGLE